MKVNKNKICMIIPFFDDKGVFPEYLDYFLESCRYNPDFNWLIFSNCSKPTNQPSNVKFEKMDVDGFNDLTSEKLGFEVNIRYPYKICDFKPTYGLIFSDFLDGFEYWGHGDLDIIYGDLNKYISDEVLGKYDVINPIKDFVCGHFCLFRNTEKINKLFEKTPEYKKILQDYKHHSFDEIGCRNYKPLLNGTPIEKIDTQYESMTHTIFKSFRNGEITIFFESILDEINLDLEKQKSFKIVWDKGRVINIRKNRDIMYFHFQCSKYSKRFNISRWREHPQKFFITENGIFFKDQQFSFFRFLEIIKYHFKARTKIFQK